MLKSKHILMAAALGLAVSAPLRAQDPKPNMPSMPNMPNMARGASQSAPADAHGTGVVKAIDPSTGMVTIAHEPIAELSWPAMTMAFKVAQPDLLKGVTVGNKIEFMLKGKDMSAVITGIKTVD